MEDYLRNAAQDQKNNYLAVQLHLTDDGVKAECTWPDDPLVAQRLFTELEYQYKARMIDATAAQRQAIRKANEQRVQPVDGATLAVLNGKKRTR